MEHNVGICRKDILEAMLNSGIMVLHMGRVAISVLFIRTKIHIFEFLKLLFT